MKSGGDNFLPRYFAEVGGDVFNKGVVIATAFGADFSLDAPWSCDQ